MKTKNILGVLLFVAFIQSSPKSHAAAHAWSGWYQISQVYTTADGSFSILLSPGSAHPNPAGCNSAAWLRVPHEQANADKMYKMALTAQASGMKVNAYVYGTQCSVGSAWIAHLRTLN